MRSRDFHLQIAAIVASLGVTWTLGGGAPRVDAGVLVERTLAFVNKKPVLLSEVLLTKALLQIDDAVALERTIDESLMFDEASRLLGVSPAEKDPDVALEILRGKAAPAFSDAALRRKAASQILIASYIELRLRPLVRVEDIEVRRLFDEKALKDPTAPEFNHVETSIRESLERRALDRKIEEWVASLRQRAEIRRPALR